MRNSSVCRFFAPGSGRTGMGLGTSTRSLANYGNSVPTGRRVQRDQSHHEYD